MLKGKRIAVIGTLRHGLATVRLLADRGAEVDLYGIEGDSEKIRDSLAGVPFNLMPGEISKDALESYHGIVLTPGGGRLFPVAIAEAAKKGVKVLTDLDLALSQYQSPVIAITGSNGKSTVAHLIRHLLQAAGKKANCAGGEGPSFSESLIQPQPYDYAILELSSSRLSRVAKIDPFIAVLLNIYPGHGERHDSFKEYALAKAKIYRDQNEGNHLVHSAMSASIDRLLKEVPAASRKVPFSFQSGLQPGITLDPDKRRIVQRSAEGREASIDLASFPLKGTQNLENALAAVAVAKLCGLDLETIESALASVPSLPDRMEPVARVAGVEYINDARASNAMAALTSLHGFPDRSVLWISGGEWSPDAQNKNLIEMIRRKVKCLLIFGSKRRQFHKLWGSGVESYVLPVLTEAVKVAAKHAGRGDTVLFSPGLRPELHTHGTTQRRGQEFKTAVAELARLELSADFT